MNFSLENLEGLKKKLIVEIPAKDIDDKIDKEIQKLSKTANLPGFRPGKVPLKVIQTKYQHDVRHDVIAKEVQTSLQKAIEESKLDIANYPSVKLITNQTGKALKYNASFEILPQVDLKDVSEIKLEKVSFKIQDSDVDNIIEELRKNLIKWHETEETAQNNYKVIIDYAGKIDDKEMDKLNGKDVSFVIGDGMMLKDFEQGVIGLKKGQSKDVNVLFPENYHEEVKGKKAIFKITVKNIYSPELPKVDAEFVKSCNIEDGSLEKLKKRIYSDLEKEASQKVNNIFKQDAFTKLVEMNQFVLPECLVQEEIERLRTNMVQKHGSKDVTNPRDLFPDNIFQKKAKFNVSFSLIVSAYIQKYKIELDHARVKLKAQELALLHHGGSKEVIEKLYKNKEFLSLANSLVIEDQIMENIESRATVEPKNLSYNDIMK